MNKHYGELLSWPLSFYFVDVDAVDLANDLLFFSNVMTTLERCSPDASVFVLVHKMDLVGEDYREQTFLDREAIIQSKTAQYVSSLSMLTLCLCSYRHVDDI